MAKAKVKVSRYGQFPFAKDWASVSQITGIPEKPFLYGWYYKNCKHTPSRMGQETYNDRWTNKTEVFPESSAYEIVKESIVIGKLLDYNACVYFEDEDLVKPKVTSASLSTEGKEFYHQSMNNLYAFLEAYKPKSIGGQQVVYDKELKYIGTYDRLVLINNELVLLDWKATNFIGYSYKLQLEAYYRALTNMVECGILKLESEKGVPYKWAKEQIMIVQLPKKEEINFDKHVIPFSADEDRFKKGFCSLLEYYYQERKEK